MRLHYFKHILMVGLALTGLGLMKAYADAEEHKKVERKPKAHEYALIDIFKYNRKIMGWKNPVTGQHVQLPQFYDYSTIYSGLRWRIFLDMNDSLRAFHKQKGIPYESNKLPSGKSPMEFDFLITRHTDMGKRQDAELEKYELILNGKRSICGKEILQGKAFGKQGKPYAFYQLDTVSDQDRKEYSVLFLQDIAEKDMLSDEDVFCPIVQSFYSTKDIGD